MPKRTGRRPRWQRRPCPSWCRDEHNELDHRADRWHVSDWYHWIQVTLGEPSRHRFGERDARLEPAAVRVRIKRHEEWEAPVAEMVVLSGNPWTRLDFTRDEAEQIGKAMLGACDVIDSRTKG